MRSCALTPVLSLSLRQRTEIRRGLRDGRPSSGLPTPAADSAAADVEGDDLAAALDAAAKIDGEEGATEQARVPWSSRDLNDSIDTGFQIASLQGPMCAEPMQGLAFFVERVEIDREAAQKENGEWQ